MVHTAYLNGAYLPADQAKISPFDRGFVFSDGVYEVVRYYAGRPFTMTEHLRRLDDSLAALRIELPDDQPGFDAVSEELIARDGQADAYVYWQVTRGAAARDHPFPDPPAPVTTFAFVKPLKPLQTQGPPPALTAITHREIRWALCAIKSVSLLGNVLARQAAADVGCDEAIFIRDDDGVVAEGTARSIFAVVDGTVRTHPLDGSILPSITRQVAIDLCETERLAIDETAVTKKQLFEADEVFAVGTTTEVRPITSIDGRPVGDGGCGPITQRLADAMRRRIIADCNL